MGTELLRVCVKEENDEIPSVPPGFESYTSFTLKRVQGRKKEDSENMISCSAFTSASESQPVHNMETEFHVGDGAKITRSLRRRPGINYGRFDDSSEDECDAEKLNQNFSLRPRLPKGVIRGCVECSYCQKVTSRWHPDAACRPILEDAPIFYPTEEEFEDTLKYIASIRPKAEPYGICRIVPPSSWKPPCLLKIKNIWETSKFATRVQRVDKLQNRDSIRKLSRNHGNMRKKRRRCTRMGVDCESSSKIILGEAEWFGFEPGPEFTLDTFQKYADDFHAQYFRKNENVIDMGGKVTILQEHQKPSVEDIEGEYWRIVEKPTEEIEVLYGADLETGAFGSGFPKMSSQVDSSLDERYIKSGWNLNNFPRLPGSILSYESGDISGVLVPWLYIGMCFSSFCWHVEDHHLYSLNFLHWGAPKIWYGVPGKDALKLEEAMKKHLPDLFEEQPDLLHKLVTQLSPSILKSDGVPVYRCVQNPGEFVLTLPRAYHSGFNCGFNCAEAVNVAPVDWLPHGQIAIGLYSEQGRKTSISHDKLLLGAAREAVRAHWELNLLKKYTSENLRWKDICGQDGILAKALKARVEIERVRREFFSNSSRAVKMESNFDATTERECIICFFDLHLSAAGCHCSPDRYACLNHAKQFCSCASDTKFFLFRYDIGELNVLVEALEGKLSAVYRWAKLDLGLALSSYVSKDKLLHINKSSHSPEPTILKQVSSQSSVNFLKDVYGKEISKYIPRNLSGFVGETSLPLDIKPSEAVLAMKDTKPSATFLRSLHEIDKVNNSSLYKKEESILLASKLGTPVCRLSQEDTSYGENLAAEQSELKKPSGAGHDDVILLSDDEVDEPKKPISDRAKDSSLSKHSDLSERPAGAANKVSPYDYDKDPFLTTPVTDAAVLGEGTFSSLPDGGRTNCSSHSVSVKDEHDVKGGTLLGSNPPNLSCHVDGGSSDAELGINNLDFSFTRDSSDHNMVITGTHQHPQSGGNGKPNNEERREKMGTITASNLVDNERSIAGSPSYPQNNLDRYFRQKGPRIAKVVRRINCNVEALEFGVVLSGKLWCNSQAIFPKGFRSRVRYISVIEPTNMCYYVSEILDAGRDGPLFVVSLEHCPSEVFIHVSAARCWEMVRDRVNQEITKKHKLGIMNLPPLQPPGSLDGFEMFGFSSPAIVQAIEAMDRHRVCTEYWDSRPYSRPQVQIHRMLEEQNDQKSPGNHLAIGVDRILGGLLKKANPDELHSLYDILIDNRRMTDRSLLTRLLNEEINKRAK